MFEIPAIILYSASVLAIAILVIVVVRSYIKNNPKELPMDEMEGHDFEYYCADLLKASGFLEVEVTKGSGDFGADILAEKDGVTYAFQCKCYDKPIGVKAVMAISIERIHQANLCNFGILPLTFKDPADYGHLDQGDRLVIENAVSQVKAGGDIEVKDLTSGKLFKMKLDVSALQRKMLLAGGRLNQIKESL